MRITAFPDLKKMMTNFKTKKAMDRQKAIAELRQVAKQNGLQIRFRDVPNEQGDFCIFIYDKSFRKSYLVGFDGDNNGHVSFEKCLKSAYNWIESRDRRFTKQGGKWLYKPYNVTYGSSNGHGGQDTYLHSFEAENAALKLRQQYTRVNVLHIDINDKVTVIRKYENN